MQTVKYNKYINLVGIEFEGLWRKSRFGYDSCELETHRWPSFILESKGDGSIEYQDTDYDEYVDGETVTRPLTESQLNKCLAWINRAFVKKDYLLNSSTGLHFHVSLTKKYYPLIDNQEFYDSFADTFKAIDPRGYYNRKNGRFCYRSLGKHYYDYSEHFTLSSPNRYLFVNYCYRKHGTVEFRAYGGKYATIEGLAKLINATLALIAHHIAKSPKTRIITAIDKPTNSVKKLNYSGFTLETGYQKVKSLDL